MTLAPRQRSLRTSRETGSTVILVMAILGLLLMFSTANLITLNVLDDEIELLDRRQQQRLEQTFSSADSSQPAAEQPLEGSSPDPSDPE